MTTHDLKTLTLPRDANPYQDLLHAALAGEGVQPRYLPMPTPSRSLNIVLIPAMLAWARVSGVRVLHLHWVFGLTFSGSATLAPLRWLSQMWFAVILFCCRALGVRLVWTAHNVLPHERVFWDDRAARTMLLRASSHIIVHDQHTADELAALAGGTAQLPPVSVVPHGSFVGHYPRTTTRAQARDRLGLPPHRRIVALVGRVTVDKGVEDLVGAFAAAYDEMAPGLPTAGMLVVAGRCTDRALEVRLAERSQELGPDVRLDLRRLPDSDLSDYLTAADVVALPFRRVTTSGSALLAMAFAKPVIVPDLAQLSGLPDAACLRYVAADPRSLRDALVRACSAPPELLLAAGAAGYEWTSSATWPAAARQTARVYRDTLQRNPLPPNTSTRKATA